jgi:hypothetical protein
MTLRQLWPSISRFNLVRFSRLRFERPIIVPISKKSRTIFGSIYPSLKRVFPYAWYANQVLQNIATARVSERKLSPCAKSLQRHCGKIAATGSSPCTSSIERHQRFMRKIGTFIFWLYLTFLQSLSRAIASNTNWIMRAGNPAQWFGAGAAFVAGHVFSGFMRLGHEFMRQVDIGDLACSEFLECQHAVVSRLARR